ncbi:glycosyltransferase [Kordia sp. TARA_039_SRF]|nr:glycosyltransferase [Kordia sp. TARA_039_SRF]
MSVKVLFITGKLQHYRVPIFNLIVKNSNIDLTVAHASKKITTEDDLFEEKILNEKKLGPFTYHKENLLKYCNEFDVVVSMLYLQKLSLMKLLFSRRKFKLLYWGIGVKASQNSEFDAPTFLNKIRYYIARKSDGMIFYTEYAKDKYIANGIKKEKLFVMNNTVEVLPKITKAEKKEILLFVGTLNKSKKILDLLKAYKKVYATNKELPILEVVGNGVDFEEANTWVKENNLSEKIKMLGAIYDELELEKKYKRALACISPGQAGLSVLSAFGHGVPFITSSNAITGGERLNIKNGFNGILFSTNEELENIIADIATNPKKYIKMGDNAQEFYHKERSPKIMAKGFIDAVNYVQNKDS